MVPVGPSQVRTCDVGSRLVPGGGLRTFRVGGSEAALGRSAPGAPPARRGSPFLPRNGEKEGRGQAPWTPGFITRSFPLARFGVGSAAERLKGYYEAHVRALIWGAFFVLSLNSMSVSLFPSAKPPLPARPAGGGRYGRKIQGRRPGRKKERTPTGSPQPEKVGPGRKNLFLPGVLSSGFLPKKAGLPRRSRRGKPRRRAHPAPVQKAPQTGPPPGRRPTGRCAPRLGSTPAPGGYAVSAVIFPASPGQGKGSPGRLPAGWSPATGPGR